MHKPEAPWTISDIFDLLFRTIGGTALRNLLLGSIIMLPAAIVMTRGLEIFLGTLSDTLIKNPQGKLSPEQLSHFMENMGLFSLVSVFFALANLAAILAVTIVACNHLSGQKVSWHEALTATFTAKLLRVWLQVAIQYTVIGLFVLGPYILFVSAMVHKSAIWGSIGFLSFVAVIVFALFLWVRWALCIPVLAHEDSTTLQAFSRSKELVFVRGHWWRTFGLLLVLNLLTQFALALITTPINMAVMWDFFAAYFQMFESLSSGSLQSDTMLRLFAEAGPGLGIAIFISTLLSLLITPLIPTVLYFDLRHRDPPHDLRGPTAEAT